jgi:hypothetical protein
MSENNKPSERVHFSDILPSIEFASWMVAALALMLRFINGPAVTGDQFLIHITLLSLALASCIILRAYSYFRRQFSRSFLRRPE